MTRGRFTGPLSRDVGLEKMKTKCAIVAMLAIFAADSFAQELSPEDAIRMWTSTNATIQEKWLAVTALFTNGTPMQDVLNTLGTNYVVIRPYSTIRVNITDRSAPKFLGTADTWYIEYAFGTNSIIISTSANISSDPRHGDMTGVGGKGVVMKIEISNATNKVSEPSVAPAPQVQE